MVNSGNPIALQKKLEELGKDEEFMKSLFAMSDPKDVQAALAQRDVDLTIEELIQIKDGINRYLDEGEAAFESDELSEDDLENVSGGIAPLILIIIVLVSFAAGCGTITGIRNGW